MAEGERITISELIQYFTFPFRPSRLPAVSDLTRANKQLWESLSDSWI
jgi:hypothetical protein